MYVIYSQQAFISFRVCFAGVKNIQALSTVIRDQTLAYVFPYSSFTFDTDLIMIVISKGKSLLPVRTSHSFCIVSIGLIIIQHISRWTAPFRSAQRALLLLLWVFQRNTSLQHGVISSCHYRGMDSRFQKPRASTFRRTSYVCDRTSQ